MGRILIPVGLIFTFGCVSSERIAPTPVILPDDPTTVIFADLQPKIRTLAWQATESFYRDDWKALAETSSVIERAARMLKTAKSPPPRLETTLPTTCDKLVDEAKALREAAEVPATERISQHLQQVHNLIRTLKPEA